MNLAEFKRHMKASVHQGSGQTRKRDKRADSARIAREVAEFEAQGGEIEKLESPEFQPASREAMKWVGNGGFEW